MRRCAALLLLAACGGEDAGPPAPRGLPARTAAEVLASLGDREGTPLLVNTWATWCAPCVAELPDLQAVARDFREHGGEVIAVAWEDGAGPFEDHGRARVGAFLDEHGYDFEVWLLADETVTALYDGLDLPWERDTDGVPMTFALDTTGTVVSYHEGRASREQLEELAAAARGVNGR